MLRMFCLNMIAHVSGSCSRRYVPSNVRIWIWSFWGFYDLKSKTFGNGYVSLPLPKPFRNHFVTIFLSNTLDKKNMRKIWEKGKKHLFTICWGSCIRDDNFLMHSLIATELLLPLIVSVSISIQPRESTLCLGRIKFSAFPFCFRVCTPLGFNG